MPDNSFRSLSILYFLLLVRVKIQKWHKMPGYSKKIIIATKVTNKETTSTENKVSKPYAAKVCGELFIVNI